MRSDANLARQTKMFARIATICSRTLGTSGAFGVALIVVVTWAMTGPLFAFSDTWQLVINTGTTIVTFLMVFLIQNTQNRDSTATQLKLDEVIRCTKGAHNAMLDLEELSQEDMDKVHALYEQLARQAREGAEHGKVATGTPSIPEERNGTRGRLKTGK
jgi:low affinity Fe/Cu permease